MDVKQVEEITKILEDNGIEWATLNVFLNRRYNSLLIPEEKWNAVCDALVKEVGPEGWKDEWDH